MNINELQQKNTVTAEYKNGIITVVADDYMKPEKSCALFMLPYNLDKMDNEYGLQEVHYAYEPSAFLISSKLFVTDMCCYIIDKNGYMDVVTKFIENNAFKEAMENEAVKFIAAVSRYCQWAGMLNALVTDAMFALHNAINDFVCDNWKEENRKQFMMLID